MAKSQKERDKAWREKNPEKSNRAKMRSSTFSYIRRATVEELATLKDFIKDREKELEKMENPT